MEHLYKNDQGPDGVKTKIDSKAEGLVGGINDPSNLTREITTGSKPAILKIIAENAKTIAGDDGVNADTIQQNLQAQVKQEIQKKLAAKKELIASPISSQHGTIQTAIQTPESDAIRTDGKPTSNIKSIINKAQSNIQQILTNHGVTAASHEQTLKANASVIAKQIVDITEIKEGIVSSKVPVSLMKAILTEILDAQASQIASAPGNAATTITAQIQDSSKICDISKYLAQIADKALNIEGTSPSVDPGPLLQSFFPPTFTHPSYTHTKSNTTII